MMRVHSKPSDARGGTRDGSLAALAVGAVLVAACSSAPIDSPGSTEPSANDAAAPSATAAPSSSAPSAGTATAPTYQKKDYPAGPYGTGVQATLENFAFLGWRDPVASGYDINHFDEVHMSDFYDPDGTTGVKLLWINASAVWCSVCRGEMADIKTNDVHGVFAPKGVQMIVTLFEDNKAGPAKPLDLHNWGSAPTQSIDFPLLLDPGFKLGAFFTSDATPLNMLVDARTMKVIDTTMGYSPDYWQRVDALLAKL